MRNTSVMKNNRKCPCCRSTDNNEIDIARDYVTFNCVTCGSFFVETDFDTAAIYQQEKYYFGSKEKGYYADYNEQTLPVIEIFLKKLIALENHRGGVGKILDFGCGLGNHLQYALSRGWKCFGVEISDHARKIAKEKLGYQSEVVSNCCEIKEKNFDLITFNDVLEHLSNPSEIFEQMFQLGFISERTKIIITTPNAGSQTAVRSIKDWDYYHPPIHLSYFTSIGLIEFAKYNRLDNISISGLYPSSDTESIRVIAKNYIHLNDRLKNSSALILESTGRRMSGTIVEKLNSKVNNYELLAERNIWIGVLNEYLKKSNNHNHVLQDQIATKEVLLIEKESLISERNREISTLKYGVLERDKTIVKLNSLLAEKNGIIDNNTANDSQITVLQEKLKSLSTFISQQDKKIVYLENNILVKDSRLEKLVEIHNDFNESEAERVNQIFELTKTISVKDERLSSLAGNLESLTESAGERDKQIVALTQAISSKDSRISELAESMEILNGTVGERDKQIGVLIEAITAKDGRLRELAENLESLSESVGERNKQISGLNGVIASQDKLIGLLNEEIAEQENQISALNRVLIGKEGVINDVTQQLTQSQYSMHKLTSSFRWKATQPIELFKEMHEGMKKRLKKYALAARTYRAHRASGVFDPAWYIENNPDLRSAGMSAWWHFLFFGILENRAPRSDFDPHAYLRLNADVAASHLGPVEHYMTFGWQEGRPMKEDLLQDNITAWVNHYRSQLVNLDKTKKTVLLVTHEISRTGAPILVLNLAEKLRKYYTVIVLSLGGGTLLEEFTGACDLFIGPLMGEQGRQDFLSGFLKGVKELHPVDCAVVNSIVSTPILKPLWENKIPSTHLIHEFSSYTRPESLFTESIEYASKHIFSSKLILENAVSDYPHLATKSPLIMPQGRCLSPLKPQDSDVGLVERARIDAILRPPGSPENLFVVIGLGTVQLRKGVDLFLECAHKVSKMKSKVPIRFVWFGHGYDVKLDGDYSVYLHDQMKRSGIEKLCAITDETDQLDHVYETADLLFLSSRLDPLPLVSQDMMAHGKPVLCFEKATGLAEFIIEYTNMKNCVIDYLDVDSAALKIVELATSRAKYISLCESSKNFIDQKFNLDHYAERVSLQCAALMKTSR